MSHTEPIKEGTSVTFCMLLMCLTFRTEQTWNNSTSMKRF